MDIVLCLSVVSSISFVSLPLFVAQEAEWRLLRGGDSTGLIEKRRETSEFLTEEAKKGVRNVCELVRFGLIENTKWRTIEDIV